MIASPTVSARIAVAEDDPAVRKSFVKLLEAMGHKVVVVAADGEQLVDECIKHEVDLVFADFHLPVMDGLAAAELIAARGIPVVLISGHPDVNNIVLDHEPIALIIQKPATAADLRAAIEKLLHQGAAWRAA
jgi:CheY-like chemotaxis protein